MAAIAVIAALTANACPGPTEPDRSQDVVVVEDLGVGR
jgi:hypothetical protein